MYIYIYVYSAKYFVSNKHHVESGDGRVHLSLDVPNGDISEESNVKNTTSRNSLPIVTGTLILPYIQVGPIGETQPEHVSQRLGNTSPTSAKCSVTSRTQRMFDLNAGGATIYRHGEFAFGRRVDDYFFGFFAALRRFDLSNNRWVPITDHDSSQVTEIVLDASLQQHGPSRNAAHFSTHSSTSANSISVGISVANWIQ